jgi:mRNA-degrading endonuclease YafQ of YafQ-DinJ toxin-antitoxin module
VRSYTATETFWRNFYALSEEQKESSRAAWAIFKVDPFDPRLRSHKIQALSGRKGRTVYSCVIEADLRVLFCLEGSTVITMDIGTHDVYR